MICLMYFRPRLAIILTQKKPPSQKKSMIWAKKKRMRLSQIGSLPPWSLTEITRKFVGPKKYKVPQKFGPKKQNEVVLDWKFAAKVIDSQILPA